MDTSSFSRYFKNILASQQYREKNFKEATRVSVSEIEEGMISQENINKFSKFNKFNNQNIPIVIIYKSLLVKYDNLAVSTYIVDNVTGVLYVPANLSSDGKLSPDLKNLYPYIPRMYLEPIEEATIIFGKTVSFDEFLTKTQEDRSLITSWSDYMNYARKLYAEVAQESIKHLLKDGKVTENSDAYILPNNSIIATKSLSRLYTDLIETKPEVNLYKAFLQGIYRDTKQNKKKFPSRKDSMLSHCAQMNDGFPSAPFSA